jgi:hypothetical protein
MNEAEFQKLVLSWLKKNRYKCWKNYLGSLTIGGGKRVVNPNSGMPDIFGISKKRNGKLFAIELKSKNGKLSEKQRVEIKELEENGVYVIVARDLDYIIDHMENFESQLPLPKGRGL